MKNSGSIRDSRVMSPQHMKLQDDESCDSDLAIKHCDEASTTFADTPGSNKQTSRSIQGGEASGYSVQQYNTGVASGAPTQTGNAGTGGFSQSGHNTKGRYHMKDTSERYRSDRQQSGRHRNHDQSFTHHRAMNRHDNRQHRSHTIAMSNNMWRRSNTDKTEKHGQESKAFSGNMNNYRDSYDRVYQGGGRRRPHNNAAGSNYSQHNYKHRTNHALPPYQPPELLSREAPASSTSVFDARSIESWLNSRAAALLSQFDEAQQQVKKGGDHNSMTMGWNNNFQNTAAYYPPPQPPQHMIPVQNRFPPGTYITYAGQQSHAMPNMARYPPITDGVFYYEAASAALPNAGGSVNPSNQPNSPYDVYVLPPNQAAPQQMVLVMSGSQFPNVPTMVVPQGMGSPNMAIKDNMSMPYPEEATHQEP